LSILPFVKLCISVAIIILATQIGRRLPSLAGLIATIPLTGVIVLMWLHSDDPGNYELMTRYTKGALWGILPSILFFLVACFCFSKHLPLSMRQTLHLGLAGWKACPTWSSRK
jgi:uncharacterized membrane protein (GlpM family)